MSTMRAAVLVKEKKFELREVPVPTIKENQVLVKIEATAICGTEVSMFTGEHTKGYPLIMGHETAGVVHKAGSAVSSVKEGDPVFIISGISCGFCEYCREGKENLCPYGGLLGREMQGSYAEYLAVPEHAVFKLPLDFPPVHATTLNLLMTVIHSHRKIRVYPGYSVVMLGLGPAGLAQLHFSKISGAGPLIGVGHREWRGRLAEDFGADKVVITKEEDPLKKIKNALGADGADLVITASSQPQAFKQAVEIAKPGATVLQFGIMGRAGEVDLYSIYFKELAILGSRATVGADFPLAVRWFLNHQELLKKIVTRTLPLEDIQEGFEMILNKEEELLRVVITY